MSSGAHSPRKRFGQNFLIDESLIERILSLINPAPTDTIIEIGPGQGALTHGLADSGARLHLLEIDRDLVARLSREFRASENVRIHEMDALELDLPHLCGRQAVRLVGNLPYNISTPLLFHVLQWPALVQDMHFMLQQEVIDRLAAAPGSRSRGRLSVMCQYHCRVTPLLQVPPESFSPRPRVQSGVVRLEPWPELPHRARSFTAFQRVVAAAFSKRRKTLRNSLAGVLSEDLIRGAGIDPGVRAETLELAEFVKLSDEVT